MMKMLISSVFAIMVLTLVATMQSPEPAIASIYHPGTESDKPQEPCECAAFDSKPLTENVKPLLSQKLVNVTCDDKGMESCHNLCTELAHLTQVSGPNIICAHLEHADKMQVYGFSRSCNQTTWKYTGISSHHPICCHNMKVVNCTSSQPD